MSAATQFQGETRLTDREHTPFSWDGDTRPFSAGMVPSPLASSCGKVGPEATFPASGLGVPPLCSH
jgi:hypothetical protein